LKLPHKKKVDQVAAKADVDAVVLEVILAQAVEEVSPVVLVDQVAVATLDAQVDQVAEVTLVAQADQVAEVTLDVLVDQVVAVTLVALVDQVAAVMLDALKEVTQVDLAVVVDSAKARAEIVHAVKENRSVETANVHN
jgi:hypothetical protein